MYPPDPDLAAAELKAMQDSIYREKILRARRQTPDPQVTFDTFVQGPETLGMAYIQHWCALHGTLPRLEDALAGIPPLD